MATPGPLPLWRSLTFELPTVAGPHTPSTSSPQLRWKSSSARGRGGPEDAVDPAAVEAEAAERRLQRADVVAAQVRGARAQRRGRRGARRLDERQPRLLVAVAGRRAGRGAPGRRTRVERRLVEATARRRPAETGGAEAALQVADGLAVLTRGQWEVKEFVELLQQGPLPLAPTSRLRTSPPENTSSVGMLITL